MSIHPCNIQHPCGCEPKKSVAEMMVIIAKAMADFYNNNGSRVPTPEEISESVKKNFEENVKIDESHYHITPKIPRDIGKVKFK